MAQTTLQKAEASRIAIAEARQAGGRPSSPPGGGMRRGWQAQAVAQTEKPKEK